MRGCLFPQNNPHREEGRNPWCSETHLASHTDFGFSKHNGPRMQTVCRHTRTIVNRFLCYLRSLLICNFSRQWTSGVLLFIATGKLPSVEPIFTKRSKAWHVEHSNKGEKTLRMIQVFVLRAFVSLSFLIPSYETLMRKAKRNCGTICPDYQRKHAFWSCI